MDYKSMPYQIDCYGNQMTNGCYILHSPISNKVIVVDADEMKLISLCDGLTTIDNIADQSVYSREKVLEDISILSSNGFIGTVNQESLSPLRSLNVKTISVWLHLTNNCNLSCDYCYIHKSPGDMTLAMAKRALDDLLISCGRYNAKSLNIKLAGGEPMLRYDVIKELVAYSKRVCGEIVVSFTLLTNATLINPEVAKYLRDNKIGVGVSLDGVDSANQARHYKDGAPSFTNVVKGLDNLRNAGVVSSIMTTVSSSNYKNLLDLTKFFIKEKYRFRFSLERDCITGKPKLLNHIDELIRVLNSCYDYLEENIPQEDIFKVHTFCDVHFGTAAKRSCGAGSNFLSIGHDGKIGICGLGLDSPFGSLDDYEGGDILSFVRSRNHELCNFVASEYENCKNCHWRTSCAGGCPKQSMSSYNRYDKASVYCKVYKAVIPRIINIKGIQMYNKHLNI